jgi:hypothetical protein
MIGELHTDFAERVHDHVSRYFTQGELDKYVFIIADYCNEFALNQRIQTELAGAELLVLYTNSHCKKNWHKNKLCQLLGESNARLLAYSKELQMTPRTDPHTDPIDTTDLSWD